MSELTPSDVVRQLFKNGWKISTIAKRIGVSQPYINSILKNDSNTKYKVFAALKEILDESPPPRSNRISKPVMMRNALRDISSANSLEDAVKLADEALRQL